MISIQPDDLTRARAIARGDDELFSVACEALTLAARDFDGRGTFSGYSGQRMAWAVANERKRLGTLRGREVSLDALTTPVVQAPTPDLPEPVENAVNGLPVYLKAALLNGPHDRRRADYRTALTQVRTALGMSA